MTIAQSLQRAVQLHQSGQLDSAERLYRDILKTDPHQPDAGHLLGVLLGQRGQAATAIALIRRAILAKPAEPIFYNNLGNLLRETRALIEATDAFTTAIQLRPDYLEAQNNLGNTQLDRGNPEAAAESYRRARELNPADARLTINLGSALVAAGKLNEALAEYRAAIRLNPSLALGFNNYGVALLRVGQTRAAVAALQRAVELEPQSISHHVHLAAAFREAGQLEEAEAACRAALLLDSRSAEAYNGLANVFGDGGRAVESVQASRNAVALNPALAESHANLGVGLGELHQFREAVAAFDTAIRLAPDFAEGHRNFGLALLTLRRFERGWREYEWRWKSPSFQRHACALIPCLASRWAGEPLNGRPILLQSEQGLGDTIQFARYIPLVAERGGAVTVSAPPSLHRLLATVSGVHRVVAELNEADAATFAVQCPLMSLPLTLEMFEPFAAEKYLSPPTNASLSLYPGRGQGRGPSAASSTPFRTEESSLPAQVAAGRLRVGLVWAGNPNLRTDRLRSIPLSQFEPILRLAADGIDFSSLQLGPAAMQLWPPLVDLTADIYDFADTAARISQLDLVIAVDTAVAHLSAALGKPTWVLIPYNADWRWQLDRSDSPWYPSMRLFRQTVAGDWTQAIHIVAEALQREVSCRER